jgi:hypothetical protein
MPGCFQFFDYEPEDIAPAKLIGKVAKLLNVAEESVDKIDGVVFPELALTDRTFKSLASSLAEDGRFLIAGTAGDGCNVARLAFPIAANTDDAIFCEQYKHHRWKLDRNQIIQYRLGSALGTDCSWWEHITLRDREVNFYQLDYWLTLSVLICEDLARQDPVAQLVRAVGPNLVIALLMDGPQMRGRWSDRYASVLADDPGSSVLTFTSIGMVNRSIPKPQWNAQSPPTQNTIALWRDPIDGATEIPLDPSAAAVVLSLNAVVDKQYTADGREASEYPRHTLILSGVHQVIADREV